MGLIARARLALAKRRLRRILDDPEYGAPLVRLPRADQRVILDLVEAGQGRQARAEILVRDAARRAKVRVRSAERRKPFVFTPRGPKSLQPNYCVVFETYYETGIVRTTSVLIEPRHWPQTRPALLRRLYEIALGQDRSVTGRAWTPRMEGSDEEFKDDDYGEIVKIVILKIMKPSY